jgi:hypothetical protein
MLLTYIIKCLKAFTFLTSIIPGQDFKRYFASSPSGGQKMVLKPSFIASYIL